MLLRAASTGAEEEIILQQVRLPRPARVSRPRRGPPSLLVHDVLLPPAPKDLVDDPHTGGPRTSLERNVETTITSSKTIN